MGTFFQGRRTAVFDGTQIQIASLFWVCSLVFGALTGIFADPLLGRSMISGVIHSNPSFASVVVPVLLSIILAYFSIRFAALIQYTLIIIKGVFLGFIGSVAYLACGNSGLLACLGLLFGSFCLLPVCWFWWLFLFRGYVRYRREVSFLVASLVFLIASFDYVFVFPFCVRMIFVEG